MNRRRFVCGASAALSYAAVAFSLPGQQSATAVVKTPNGTLRGESVGRVQIFRGIPFAQPPVGELRFRPPVKAKAWTGERDALRFAPARIAFT